MKRSSNFEQATYMKLILALLLLFVGSSWSQAAEKQIFVDNGDPSGGLETRIPPKAFLR